MGNLFCAEHNNLGGFRCLLVRKLSKGVLTLENKEDLAFMKKDPGRWPPFAWG